MLTQSRQLVYIARDLWPADIDLKSTIGLGDLMVITADLPPVSRAACELAGLHVQLTLSLQTRNTREFIAAVERAEMFSDTGGFTGNWGTWLSKVFTHDPSACPWTRPVFCEQTIWTPPPVDFAELDAVLRKTYMRPLITAVNLVGDLDVAEVNHAFFTGRRLAGPPRQRLK